MQKTNKFLSMSLTMGVLLLGFTHTQSQARTTDVTMPSYLIQREYSTEEALALKQYDLAFRQKLKVANASRDLAQRSNDKEFKERNMRFYNETLEVYQLQLKYECWNEYKVSKTKGAHSETCYLLSKSTKNKTKNGPNNAFLAKDKLDVSEQRGLAYNREELSKQMKHQVAQNRRAEQD